MTALRIGLLGAARIAGKAVALPARETGARLVAVAARDRARAEAFAAEHGVERVLGSYAAVLADPEVEVVYNALPNGLHAPWNLAAVRAGKHVLTEKPSASDAEEAAEVRDAARAAGVSVVEGFHYAHHPVAQRLHGLLDSGELGELRAVEVHMLMSAPDDADPRWSFELAGGALMDLGCYGLHVMRSLAAWGGGPPAVTGARGRERAGRPGVDEAVDVDLVFPGGATGTLVCDMAAPARRFSCRVVGTDGEAEACNYVLPQTDDRVLVTTRDGEREERLGERSTYTYQLEALSRHLREGEPFLVSPDDSVATMQLLDDTYRAAGLPLRPRSPMTGDDV